VIDRSVHLGHRGLGSGLLNLWDKKDFSRSNGDRHHSHQRGGILLAVAVCGTVYPVLPGSPVALVTLIAWGWVLGSAASWTAAGIGVLLACVGCSASALLTGRKLKRQHIPRRSPDLNRGTSR